MVYELRPSRMVSIATSCHGAQGLYYYYYSCVRSGIKVVMNTSMVVIAITWLPSGGGPDESWIQYLITTFKHPDQGSYSPAVGMRLQGPFAVSCTGTAVAAASWCWFAWWLCMVILTVLYSNVSNWLPWQPRATCCIEYGNGHQNTRAIMLLYIL